MARLFFALWPPAALADTLGRVAVALQREVGGRVTRTDSIHLTLAFLGDVPETAMDVLVGAPCGRPGGEMTLDVLGAWRHNRIGWIAPSKVPPRLAEVQSALVAWLTERGFAPDRRPYRPHVTLVRRARHALDARPAPPLVWPLDDVVLVRSELDAGGPRYRVLARFGAVD